MEFDNITIAGVIVINLLLIFIFVILRKTHIIRKQIKTYAEMYSIPGDPPKGSHDGNTKGKKK